MKFAFAFLLSALSVSAVDLRVTVYGASKLIPELDDDLRRIFRQSGIQLHLVRGDESSDEFHLIMYPAIPSKDQVVQARCRARRDVALEIRDSAPQGIRPSVLGVAEPLARAGLNVRVFSDRIRQAAFRENRPYAGVLAHVIAHEIGHVFLRTGEHTSWGLMSGSWRDQEYRLMPTGSLLFTPKQAEMMAAALVGKGCPDGPR